MTLVSPVKGTVLYNGTWLCKGFMAYELHRAGEQKKLREHMKDVDERYKRLLQ